MSKRSDLACPMVRRPMPEYKSMASGKMITSRWERQEDLKRTGCREVDPSEFKPRYRNKKYAVANNGEHDPNAGDEYSKKLTRI